MSPEVRAERMISEATRFGLLDANQAARAREYAARSEVHATKVIDRIVERLDERTGAWLKERIRRYG